MSNGFVDLEQYQNFQATPKYIKHQALEDRLAILVCQIKIWQAKGVDWFNIPKVTECLTIRECENIEITESYKDLISKAVLHFPRGTVVEQSYKSKGKVNVGSRDEQDEEHTESSIDVVSGKGELLTSESLVYKDDLEPVVSMAPNYDDKGLIDYNRSKTDKALLQPNDIAIGNRIEIRLGYAYSEEEYDKMTQGEGVNNELDLAFTGFITSISVDTPLEIECEDMAHVLTTISIPRDINDKGKLGVKDFLGKGGKYDLLKNTGLELSNDMTKNTIDLKGCIINHNLTIADVLTEWSKSGIVCFMETDNCTGKATLRVGMVYYAGQGGGALPNNDPNYVTYNGGNNSVTIIQFDWDVADDKLSLMHNDKKYLAVEAQGRTKDNHWIKFTVRKHPNIEDEGWVVESDGNFDIVNERKERPKKKSKRKNGTGKNAPKDTTGTTTSGHLENKVDLSKYTVIPFISAKKTVTRESLLAEAKQYWASYVPNGISGSLTVFGDLYIKPTEIVGLVDPRQPQKNGYYLVESVETTFGVDGYRRELKIPYKIAKFNKNVEII